MKTSGLFYRDNTVYPFAYMRKKTSMRKKKDFGELINRTDMMRVYDCKSRLFRMILFR